MHTGSRALGWLCFVRSLSSLLIMQDEVSLYDNAKERRQWDKLSEFFAIIKTTEHLENARIKSAIGRDEVHTMSMSVSMLINFSRDTAVVGELCRDVHSMARIISHSSFFRRHSCSKSSDRCYW